ncbi:hypothetical protein EJ08DRAFT_644450 [Tothia fuscella]|uniref:Uncharacterized protein n=1 Tax=Tothia fuscella TaxID=1048955 RepID=A0A9P4P3W2_9PEZI|nr:hypothetical protein EJ08DRAFT_644450 [Tothia fuscella]
MLLHEQHAAEMPPSRRTLLGLLREIRNHIYSYLCDDLHPLLRCTHTPYKPRASVADLTNTAPQFNTTLNPDLGDTPPAATPQAMAMTHPHALILVGHQISAEYVEHTVQYFHVIFDFSYLLSSQLIREWAPSRFMLDHLRRVTFVLTCSQPWQSPSDFKEDILWLIGELIVNLKVFVEVNLVINHIALNPDLENEHILPLFLWEEVVWADFSDWGWMQYAIQAMTIYAANRNPSVSKLGLRQNSNVPGWAHSNIWKCERGSSRAWIARCWLWIPGYAFEERIEEKPGDHPEQNLGAERLVEIERVVREIF